MDSLRIPLRSGAALRGRKEHQKKQWRKKKEGQKKESSDPGKLEQLNREKGTRLAGRTG